MLQILCDKSSTNVLRGSKLTVG